MRVRRFHNEPIPGQSMSARSIKRASPSLLMRRATTEDQSVFSKGCLYAFRVPWIKKLASFPVPESDVVFLHVGTTDYAELPFGDIEQAALVFAKHSLESASLPDRESTLTEVMKQMHIDGNIFNDFAFVLRFRRNELDERGRLPEIQGIPRCLVFS